MQSVSDYDDINLLCSKRQSALIGPYIQSLDTYSCIQHGFDYSP